MEESSGELEAQVETCCEEGQRQAESLKSLQKDLDMLQGDNMRLAEHVSGGGG